MDRRWWPNSTSSPLSGYKFIRVMTSSENQLLLAGTNRSQSAKWSGQTEPTFLIHRNRPDSNQSNLQLVQLVFNHERPVAPPPQSPSPVQKSTLASSSHDSSSRDASSPSQASGDSSQSSDQSNDQAGHQCTLCGQHLEDRIGFNHHIKQHLKEKLNSRQAQRMKQAGGTAVPTTPKPVPGDNHQSPKPEPTATNLDVMAELGACQPLPRDSHLIKDQIVNKPSPSISDTSDKEEENSIKYDLDLNRMEFNQDLTSILEQIDFEEPALGLHDISLDTPPDSDAEATDYFSSVVRDISLDIGSPPSPTLISNPSPTRTTQDLLGFDSFATRIGFERTGSSSNVQQIRIPGPQGSWACASSIASLAGSTLSSLDGPRMVGLKRSENSTCNLPSIEGMQEENEADRGLFGATDPTIPKGHRAIKPSGRSRLESTSSQCVGGHESPRQPTDELDPLIRHALTGSGQPARMTSSLLGEAAPTSYPAPNGAMLEDTLGKPIQQSASSLEKVGQLPAQALAILGQLPSKVFLSNAGSESRLVNVVKVERSSYPTADSLAPGQKSPAPSVTLPLGSGATPCQPMLLTARPGQDRRGVSNFRSNHLEPISANGCLQPYTVINIECHQADKNGRISGKIIESYKAIDTGQEIKLLVGHDPSSPPGVSTSHGLAPKRRLAGSKPLPPEIRNLLSSTGVPEKSIKLDVDYSGLSDPNTADIRNSHCPSASSNLVACHKCHDCNLSFSTKESFFSHVNVVHQPNLIGERTMGTPGPNPIWAESISSMAGAQDLGLASSTASSSAICNVCRRSFQHRNELARHERMPDGKLTSFICRVCVKQRKNKISFVRQRSRHSNSCIHCSKVFQSKISLHEHLLQMHQDSATFSVERPPQSTIFRGQPHSGGVTLTLDSSITAKRGDNFLFNPDDMSLDESMDSDDCFSLSSRASARLMGRDSSIGGGDSILSEVEEDDVFMVDQPIVGSTSDTMGESLANISNANFFDFGRDLEDEFCSTRLF